MGFYINKAGAAVHVELDMAVYSQAKDENKQVSHVINAKYGADVDDKIGRAHV